jgi:hypothetical protein
MLPDGLSRRAGIPLNAELVFHEILNNANQMTFAPLKFGRERSTCQSKCDILESWQSERDRLRIDGRVGCNRAGASTVTGFLALPVVGRVDVRCWGKNVRRSARFGRR